MKSKQFIFFVVALFTLLPGVFAQNARLSEIKIENLAVEKQDDQVSVSFLIVLDALKIKSNDMWLLTPVIKSKANGLDKIVLPQMVVSGKKRHKIMTRREVLGEPIPIDDDPMGIVVRKNRRKQSTPYQITIPFRSWMRDASISLQYELSGCAECNEPLGENLLSNTILPQPYEPVYRLTYIVPEAEEVKIRSERHTATFNFVVNKWELLRDFKGNAAQLDSVDRVLNEIRKNPDLNITEFELHGFASPEGSVSHNQMLAQNRANAFAEYLMSKFSIARNRFTVTGHGEDWTGLRKAVEASHYIADRQAILSIIDNVTNPDARDAELMKLSGGSTYRTLLNDYYPALRRTEYVVAYSVRPFSVEEARIIIKTNPKLLSLNEMYLVAKSYPVDSDEFIQVFDIAARLYPDSDVAILNSAAADIEGGNMVAAIARLNRIGDNPKVWNNLGVAHALKGDFDKAMEYLNKAAEEDDGDALFNREELEKALKN